MSSPSKNPPPSTPSAAISEVRYSLPQLLREVQEERRAPAFAMEKLDQVEIAKLFTKNKRPRRAQS